MHDLFQQLPNAISFLLDLAFFVSPLQGYEFDFLPETISNNPIFLSYIPLVLSIKAIEGMLVGSHVRKHHPIRFFIAIIAIFGGIYFFYERIPSEILNLTKFSWMIIGVLIASSQFTKKFEDHPLFGATISRVSLFIMFCVVSLHISNDQKILLFSIGSFPVGFFIGYIFAKKPGWFSEEG